LKFAQPMLRTQSKTGVIIALIVISIWCLCIFFLMNWEVDFKNPFLYLLILVQMHLYTGLFITAHDAMHGTVSSNRILNNVIGQICTVLYACFPFSSLYTKHHEHHKYVHTDKDPDYSEGNFFIWYLDFIKQYLSWWQVILMALIFNLLKIWVPELNLFLFWVLPSLLSTLQLFYFGTWLPHHGEHTNKHQSGSQKKNHILAFLSCYFFGYHFEHHDSPGTPWWRLWKLKNS
jgi:beta-carotene ketolase (CrtW type)